MPMEAFLINPAKLRKNKRKKRRTTKRKRRRNPLGEEAMILGANRPRRRRRRKARRRRNYATVANRPRRRRRRRRYNPPVAYAANRPRRRRYRRRRRYNPPVAYAANRPRRRRYRRRRYRRNPAAAMLKVRPIDLKDPMTVVAPILTGIVAKTAVDRLPTMMNLVGNQRTIAQLGIALGGGFMLNGLVGPIGATVWAAVAAAEALNDIVNRAIAQMTQGVPAVSGIEYPAYGAYPNEFFGAYPNEMPSYPF